MGARGLMQITDETFLWIKSKIAPGEEITFDDLFDPAVNIRFGTYLLATCLARYDGDFSTAAAAWGLWTVCCRRRNILRMEKLLRHSPMSR